MESAGGQSKCNRITFSPFTLPLLPLHWTDTPGEDFICKVQAFSGRNDTGVEVRPHWDTTYISYSRDSAAFLLGLLPPFHASRCEPWFLSELSISNKTLDFSLIRLLVCAVQGSRHMQSPLVYRG